MSPGSTHRTLLRSGGLKLGSAPEENATRSGGAKSKQPIPVVKTIERATAYELEAGRYARQKERFHHFRGLQLLFLPTLSAPRN